MACKRLREMIDAGRPAFGLWVSITDPAVVELAAYAGYDYVNIDLEHSSLDLRTVENMIRASEARGISAMVRVPVNQPKVILPVVELGPDGIFIPHVRDAADARQAVIAAKYAPLGDRGISASTRAALYGAYEGDFAGHAEKINRSLIVHAQIEEQSAVDDIDAIAAVDGIDVCGVAPSDLARAFGCMGSRNDPRVGAAIEKVAAAVRKVGKAKLAVPIGHGNYDLDTEAVVKLGAVMISCGRDSRALMSALSDNMKRARKNLPA